jgi:hypothetical protein
MASSRSISPCRASVLGRELTICLKSPDSLSAALARHRRFHDLIVAAVRAEGGDGVSNDTDGVFCDADTLPRHKFVNYMTVSHQPIGLTHDPRMEIWIRGR